MGCPGGKINMAAVSVKGLNDHFFTEGVSSTPTFFLNGMFLAGDVSTKWTALLEFKEKAFLT